MFWVRLRRFKTVFVSPAPLCCGCSIVLLRPFQVLQRLKDKDSNNGGSTSKEPVRQDFQTPYLTEQVLKEIFYHIVFTVRKMPYIQTSGVRKICANSGQPASQSACAHSSMSSAHALQAIQQRHSAETTWTRSLAQPQPALYSANVVTITKSWNFETTMTD